VSGKTQPDDYTSRFGRLDSDLIKASGVIRLSAAGAIHFRTDATTEVTVTTSAA